MNTLFRGTMKKGYQGSKTMKKNKRTEGEARLRCDWQLDMINRALVCPRRYCSGSRPEFSRMAAPHFFGSLPAASTAAGAMILYLRVRSMMVGIIGART